MGRKMRAAMRFQRERCNRSENVILVKSTITIVIIIVIIISIIIITIIVVKFVVIIADVQNQLNIH